jgi:hypothetical protein
MFGISRYMLTKIAIMTVLAAGTSVLTSAADAKVYHHYRTAPSTRAFAYEPQPYPYGAPMGYGRPPGVLPRDRVASPGRGDPGHTWQNATTEPF